MGLNVPPLGLIRLSHTSFPRVLYLQIGDYSPQKMSFVGKESAGRVSRNSEVVLQFEGCWLYGDRICRRFTHALSTHSDCLSISALQCSSGIITLTSFTTNGNSHTIRYTHLNESRARAPRVGDRRMNLPTLSESASGSRSSSLPGITAMVSLIFVTRARETVGVRAGSAGRTPKLFFLYDRR